MKPGTKYGVIVADPVWRIEPWSTIKAHPVWTIAARDAVLFLWAPPPMLPQALEIMTAWGFRYRSHAVWLKDRPGAGTWFRNRHELLLVGTRGALPAPAPGTQWPSVIEAPAGRHAKPEVFLDMIEAAFPDLPKIEVNRHDPPRAGWDVWGTEAEAADD